MYICDPHSVPGSEYTNKNSPLLKLLAIVMLKRIPNREDSSYEKTKKAKVPAAVEQPSTTVDAPSQETTRNKEKVHTSIISFDYFPLS